MTVKIPTARVALLVVKKNEETFHDIMDAGYPTAPIQTSYA